jgi:hypothetical protein
LIRLDPGNELSPEPVNEWNGDLSPAETIAGGLDYFRLAENPEAIRFCLNLEFHAKIVK